MSVHLIEKKSGTLGFLPWGWGMEDPIKRSIFPVWSSWPNLMEVGKTVWAHVWVPKSIFKVYLGPDTRVETVWSKINSFLYVLPYQIWSLYLKRYDRIYLHVWVKNFESRFPSAGTGCSKSTGFACFQNAVDPENFTKTRPQFLVSPLRTHMKHKRVACFPLLLW